MAKYDDEYFGFADRFCPNCKKMQFVKVFENDDFADFYCPSCSNYHKAEKVGETNSAKIKSDING